MGPPGESMPPRWAFILLPVDDHNRSAAGDHCLNHGLTADGRAGASEDCRGLAVIARHRGRSHGPNSRYDGEGHRNARHRCHAITPDDRRSDGACAGSVRKGPAELP